MNVTEPATLLCIFDSNVKENKTHSKISPSDFLELLKDNYDIIVKQSNVYLHLRNLERDGFLKRTRVYRRGIHGHIIPDPSIFSLTPAGLNFIYALTGRLLVLR